MLKKINYILDRGQKIKLIILLFVIIIGAFVELLGVSAMLPVVNVALNPKTIDETWYLSYIRDLLNIKDVNSMVIFLASVIIVIYVLKNVYISAMYYFQYKFIFNNQRRLSIKMMKCYMSQDYLFHVSRNVAELQRNVDLDVSGCFTVILNFLQMVAEASVCFMLIVFLMLNDVITTIVVSFIMALVGLFFGVIFRKVLYKNGEENRKLSITVSKWLLQSFTGIKDIKVSNNESFFINKYSNNYSKFSVLQIKQSLLKYVPKPIIESLCICGVMVALIVKLSIGNADIKSFIPTLTVFAVAAFRMLPSFNRITGNMGAMMFELPSINALYSDLVEMEQLIQIKENIQKENDPIKFSDNILVENVSFSYPESEKMILNNANLMIEKNKSIAFVGASGAGKTTLVDIILGLLIPQKGKIFVDGKDIQEHIVSWHKCLGYIPQSIYLMDDTIKANVAFGLTDNEIDEKELNRALEEAQLSELIASLPNGVNTIIGDRGVKLSGGQRQRIGIARALYRNPEILILDEATSALDNETEKEIMQAIDSLRGHRTLIVIAHRLSTIKNCDYIYEVGDGKINIKKHSEIFS